MCISSVQKELDLEEEGREAKAMVL